ncbi:MAG: hypothetical protein R3C58_04055 [Parvularculaceae bacterium]
MMTDELRARYTTGKDLGIVGKIDLDTQNGEARIFLIDDNEDQAERLIAALGEGYAVIHEDRSGSRARPRPLG